MPDQIAQSNELKDLTFEEALQELDRIVSQLESEQLDLNESLELFERGQILGNHCVKILEEAELKVT